MSPTGSIVHVIFYMNNLSEWSYANSPLFNYKKECEDKIYFSKLHGSCKIKKVPRQSTKLKDVHSTLKLCLTIFVRMSQQ